MEFIATTDGSLEVESNYEEFQSLVGSGVYCDLLSLLATGGMVVFQSLVGSGVYCDSLGRLLCNSTTEFQSLVGSGVYCDVVKAVERDA